MRDRQQEPEEHGESSALEVVGEAQVHVVLGKRLEVPDLRRV
jgi:hypothetical protein